MKAIARLTALFAYILISILVICVHIKMSVVTRRRMSLLGPGFINARPLLPEMFEYTVEHCSTQLTWQEQERESKMFREVS